VKELHNWHWSSLSLYYDDMGKDWLRDHWKSYTPSPDFGKGWDDDIKERLKSLLQEHIMCRSIKTLRNTEIPATEEEIRAAALQFVRKVSGYRKPSKVNEETFERAVEEVADATQKLLQDLALKVKA